MATIIDRDSGGGAAAVVIALLAAGIIAIIAFGGIPTPQGTKAPVTNVHVTAPTAPAAPTTH